MKDFENKVDKLIEKLKKYKSCENIFNPWSDTDKNDKCSKAPQLRCENLKKYLLSHKNAKYIMLAESPSHGCHYTGIAMTSERVIRQYPHLFSGYKTTSLSGDVREGTAAYVWEMIQESEKNFVLWNAFVFQTYKNNFSPRKPSAAELKDGIDILREFLELFPKRKEIIAVGKTAENILLKNKILADNDKYRYIRHPSCGGVSEFRKGMQGILEKIK